MRDYTISYQTVPIHYSDGGVGKVLVLLHGYLESLEIWSAFANELSKKYRVIAVDLPGHGKTGTKNGAATVEFMAECVKAVLDHLNIKKSILVAHSMGGYAMLAFADMWPEMLNGIGLFHSISWADLPEKREARDREIELVKQGKKTLIFNANVPKGFANDNLDRMKDEVEKAKLIASSTTDEGIIAALKGMKDRKDRTYVLKNIEVPVFFGIGKKDNYIPIEKIMALTALPKQKHITIFENSGHMGFIEERDYAIDEIEQFIEMC